MSTLSWKKWKEKYPEKVKENGLKYYSDNKDKILLRNRERYLSNSDLIKINHKKYYDSLKPWEKSLKFAKSRCNNISSPSFKWYGFKGIKCLLTREDLKFIWNRDKAFELKNPSLDRIDSNGNYEFSNCRFIDKYENSLRSVFGKMGWSRNFKKCILCGKNDTKHNSKGRCSRCYNKLWLLKKHVRN